MAQDLIELSLYTNSIEDDWSLDGQVVSLREMRSLKHLRVAYRSLVDDHVEPPEQASRMAALLPPSLETLRLHWDERYYGDESYRRRPGYVNEVVTGFLQNGQMPNLRQVTLEWYYVTGKAMKSKLNELIFVWDLKFENMPQWATRGRSRCTWTTVTFRRNE